MYYWPMLTYRLFRLHEDGSKEIMAASQDHKALIEIARRDGRRAYYTINEGGYIFTDGRHIIESADDLLENVSLAWVSYSFWIGFEGDQRFRVFPENEIVTYVKGYGWDHPSHSGGAWNCRVKFDDGHEKDCRIIITWGDIVHCFTQISYQIRGKNDTGTEKEWGDHTGILEKLAIRWRYWKDGKRVLAIDTGIDYKYSFDLIERCNV